MNIGVHPPGLVIATGLPAPAKPARSTRSKPIFYTTRGERKFLAFLPRLGCLGLALLVDVLTTYGEIAHELLAQAYENLERWSLRGKRR